jgi:hypothetical protein
MRRSTAIAESSDRSSHPAPTSTARTASGAPFALAAIGRVCRPSPRRHLPCRGTPLHSAAHNGASDAIAELLLRGADGAVQENYSGYG